MRFFSNFMLFLRETTSQMSYFGEEIVLTQVDFCTNYLFAAFFPSFKSSTSENLLKIYINFS